MHSGLAIASPLCPSSLRQWVSPFECRVGCPYLLGCYAGAPMQQSTQYARIPPTSQLPACPNDPHEACISERSFYMTYNIAVAKVFQACTQSEYQRKCRRNLVGGYLGHFGSHFRRGWQFEGPRHSLLHPSSSCFAIAFTSSNSPFILSWNSCSSHRVTARPLSPALAFGSGPLDDDDRPCHDLPGVASSVSTSNCVGRRSKSAA